MMISISGRGVQSEDELSRSRKLPTALKSGKHAHLLLLVNL